MNPVLDAQVAHGAGVSDEEILTTVLDYSVPSRNRPVLRPVSYAELKSGEIDIKGKKVKTHCLSDLSRAKKIASTLKHWIEEGAFYLTEPVESLSREGACQPMHESRTRV